jgi:hypothetical protein
MKSRSWLRSGVEDACRSRLVDRELDEAEPGIVEGLNPDELVEAVRLEGLPEVCPKPLDVLLGQALGLEGGGSTRRLVKEDLLANL